MLMSADLFGAFDDWLSQNGSRRATLLPAGNPMRYSLIIPLR